MFDFRPKQNNNKVEASQNNCRLFAFVVLARLILVDPQKKDRAVMQEIYFWDQEEILEKSTAIVAVERRARRNTGRS